MSEDRGTLRSIAWQEVFPALHLFSALRMALNFRALLLAAVALVGITAGWRIIAKPFERDDDKAFQAALEENGAWPWETPLVVEVDLSGQQPVPLVRAWSKVSLPFIQVFSADASFTQFVYWLLCALWALAVWAFFGGVITRAAAVSFARQENQSWGQVAGFVRQRWTSYFVAPLFPILGTF